MFSTLPKTNFNFSNAFNLTSANALNLDQSKILSFGEELSEPDLISESKEETRRHLKTLFKK